MQVRHPFERLVSAYQSKVVRSTDEWYIHFFILNQFFFKLDLISLEKSFTQVLLGADSFKRAVWGRLLHLICQDDCGKREKGFLLTFLLLINFTASFKLVGSRQLP